MVEYVKLKELCTVNQGLQIPISKRKKEPGPNRYFYITIQFLKNNVDNYYIENPPIATTCSKDELLMVRTGNTGQVITGVEGCFHNNFFKVKPNDRIIPKYMFYVLKSDLMYKRILNAASGTTIPDLKHSSFYELDIPLPTIEVQKKISDMLECIDKKMETNNAINRNLMEQVIAQFNHLMDELEDCTEVTLSELCAFQEGYVNPSQNSTEYFDGDVKWLRAVDINESFIVNTSRTLTQEGFKSAKKSALLFNPNTIAISKSGTVGRLGIIADYMCGNRAVINIRPHQDKMLPFLYAYLKSRQAEFADFAVGSVQKNLYVSVLEPLKVKIPSDSVILDNYCNLGRIELEQMNKICQENNALMELRDTLLPKLMSGEIDVSELVI